MQKLICWKNVEEMRLDTVVDHSLLYKCKFIRSNCTHDAHKARL